MSIAIGLGTAAVALAASNSYTLDLLDKLGSSVGLEMAKNDCPSLVGVLAQTIVFYLIFVAILYIRIGSFFLTRQMLTALLIPSAIFFVVNAIPVGGCSLTANVIKSLVVAIPMYIVSMI